MILIEKDFSAKHKLHKSFNGSSVKVSYSFLPKVKSIINSHNRKILHLSSAVGDRTCKCINKPYVP